MKPQTLPYQQGSSAGYTNRAQEIRRDDDIVKVPKITLYDIDYAVYYHLQNNVKPQIIDNGSVVPVPVIFSNGEKWAQIRQQGYLRDNNRKVLAPLMALKRNDVSSDDRIPMLSTNLSGPSTFSPKMKMIPYRTSNMQYDRVAGQYASKDSYEFYLLDMPSYCRVSYDLIIWTDLMEQMNSIIQMLVPISDHIWGDFYKFRTNIQSITHDNVNIPGEDRLIKTTVNLLVDGYLRNEYEYYGSTMQKAYSLKRIDVLNETTDEVIFDQISDLQLPNTQPQNIADVNSNSLRKQIRL